MKKVFIVGAMLLASFILGASSSIALARGNTPILSQFIQRVWVENWPAIQKVTVENQNPLPVSFPATGFNVEGSVEVTNLPKTQNVEGNVAVTNLPETQKVQITNPLPLPVTMGGGTQQWQYHKSCESAAGTWNNLGSQGWEMIEVYNTGAAICGTVFVYKKPL